MKIIYYLYDQSVHDACLENMEISEETYNSHRWESFEVPHLGMCECGMLSIKTQDIFAMYHHQDYEDDEWPECTYSEEDYLIMDIVE